MSQEFKQLLRKPFPTILTLFGIPILYTFLFGFLYSANVVRNIPLVVYDQDQTATSRTVVQAFADSERYNIVGQVSSQEELDHYLHHNNAMAAVLIPPNFSRDIKMSHSTQALVETNATNLMFANGVLSSSQEIIQTFSTGAGQKLLEGMSYPPAEAFKAAAPVRLSLRITNNPTTSYSNFIMTGLSINGLQIGIFLVACTLLTTDYKSLARRRELSPEGIILGKLLPCWLLSLLSGLFCIAILILYFQLPFRGNPLHLLLISSAFTFVMSNLGLFISAAAPKVLATMQNTAIYIISSFLCSGYSWPQFTMNSFGQAFATCLPITYAGTTIRDIMLAGYAPNLLRNSVVLFGAGLVCLLLAILSFTIRRKQFTAPCQEELT